jgi:predicted RecA/RadA family phage recombinase
MKNYVQPGDTLTVTAPYALTSGDGCKVGAALFGVAANDALINATDAEIKTEGVFDLPNGTGVIAAGALVYWDDGDKDVTTTAGGNLLIGVAVVAAASGDATVRVKLTEMG